MKNPIKEVRNELASIRNISSQMSERITVIKDRILEMTQREVERYAIN